MPDRRRDQQKRTDLASERITLRDKMIRGRQDLLPAVLRENGRYPLKKAFVVPIEDATDLVEVYKRYAFNPEDAPGRNKFISIVDNRDYFLEVLERYSRIFSHTEEQKKVGRKLGIIEMPDGDRLIREILDEMEAEGVQFADLEDLLRLVKQNPDLSEELAVSGGPGREGITESCIYGPASTYIPEGDRGNIGQQRMAAISYQKYASNRGRQKPTMIDDVLTALSQSAQMKNTYVLVRLNPNS